MTQMKCFILMIDRKHNKTGPCGIPAMQFANLEKSNFTGGSWSRISICQLADSQTNGQLAGKFQIR